jgi:CRISPR/Cas system-associated protein Csm6
MGTDDVDQVLGAPTRRTHRKEGTLAVTVRTYDTASGRVVAEFVEGVLFRYTITSR